MATPDVTRVTMLLRANCLAKGNSGVRAIVVEQLLALLDHDVLPLIPERGSCGASGDLVPLSYVGRALTGRPTFCTTADRAMPVTRWPTWGSCRSSWKRRRGSHW